MAFPVVDEFQIKSSFPAYDLKFHNRLNELCRETYEERQPGYLGTIFFSIPSFFILENSVAPFMSSFSAAPPLPYICQRDISSAANMWSRSVSVMVFRVVPDVCTSFLILTGILRNESG